ncbi:MAG: GNAT family N-acetyltransferase [Beijerinckiaceae bacterium]
MSIDLSHWTPPPFPERQTLEGRWCRLEPLSVERHGTVLWKHLAGHDGLWEFLFQAPSQSEAEYRALLQGMESRADIIPLAMIDKADGEAKGHLWIMEIRPAHGVFEVGSITWSPAMQRTRIATEAIFLVGDYGFSLGYRRYEWKCNNRNEPSKRAAERFGFTYEGLFRQHMVIKGKNRDTAWYSITDGEWPQRKARFEAWLGPGNFDAEGRQLKALDAS